MSLLSASFSDLSDTDAITTSSSWPRVAKTTGLLTKMFASGRRQTLAWLTNLGMGASYEPKPKRRKSQFELAVQRQFGQPPASGHRLLDVFIERIYWSLRSFQFWLCFEAPEPVMNVVEKDEKNLLPPSLRDLSERTGFKDEWLKFMYREFKKECPTGRMTEGQFKHIFQHLFVHTASNSFATRMFRAIDTNDAGYISFEDFIITLWQGNQASSVDFHVQWFLRLVNPEIDGLVEFHELKEYIQAVCELNGVPDGSEEGFESQFTTSDVLNWTAQVFDVLDSNHDGVLCEEDLYEFYKNMGQKSDYCSLEDCYPEQCTSSDIHITAAEPRFKRSTLSGLYYGKRGFNLHSLATGKRSYMSSKKSNGLYSLSYGKRAPLLQSMAYGKRQLDKLMPTMAFGKRGIPLQSMAFGK